MDKVAPREQRGRPRRGRPFMLGGRGAPFELAALFVGLCVSDLAGAQATTSEAAPPAETGEPQAEDGVAAPTSEDVGEESTESSLPEDDETASEEEPTEAEPVTKQTAPSKQPEAPLDDAPTSSRPASVHPKSVEDDDSWLSWPFSDSAEDVEPGQRWAGVGGFVGWVHRPSKDSALNYRPGVAYGGYIRPEVTSWLGLRLFYREERLPVSVQPGAFDTEDDSFDFDFSQPDIEVINLGARLEPTWVVHPRFRLRAIAGWSWLRMSAGVPTADGFQMKRTFRSAVQTEVSLGVGLSVDIIQDWLDVGVDVARSFPSSQTGDAYERQQVIVDGEILHIAPLPRLRAGTDVIFSLGLVL